MIKIAAALANVRELFLDTAPIIYHVEGNLAYQPLTDQVFQTTQAGASHKFWQPCRSCFFD